MIFYIGLVWLQELNNNNDFSVLYGKFQVRLTFLYRKFPSGGVKKMRPM